MTLRGWPNHGMSALGLKRPSGLETPELGAPRVSSDLLGWRQQSWVHQESQATFWVGDDRAECTKSLKRPSGLETSVLVADGLQRHSGVEISRQSTLPAAGDSFLESAVLNGGVAETGAV